MRWMTASASSSRPWMTNQRGDSGSRHSATAAAGRRPALSGGLLSWAGLLVRRSAGISMCKGQQLWPMSTLWALHSTKWYQQQQMSAGLAGQPMSSAYLPSPRRRHHHTTTTHRHTRTLTTHTTSAAPVLQAPPPSSASRPARPGTQRRSARPPACQSTAAARTAPPPAPGTWRGTPVGVCLGDGRGVGGVVAGRGNAWLVANK